MIKIAIIIIKVTKSSCNSWLLFLLGHRRAVMRLLQPEPLQLLGDSSDVGQILCLRVEESSEKKKCFNFIYFQKKKKEKHWKLCHAQGERREEGSFLAVAIPYSGFVCC